MSGRDSGVGKFSVRLRSNSGLSLHTNEDALRQYTDYNPDGSPRMSLFGPVIWQPQAAIDAVTGEVGLGVTGLGVHGPPEYRRSMLPEYSPAGMLPIPDFFGREVFQMVLRNPTTSHLLCKFAQSQGCGEAVEFLTKVGFSPCRLGHFTQDHEELSNMLQVQEYSFQVSELTKLLALISTNYTSITASSPINLPGHISKSLNSDIKHLSGSLLPGLDAVFLESRTCIEQRIARDIYPQFVKHQLALATSVSLATNSPFPFSYPGLGDCFCLTDAMSHDNPIEFASDGFVSVTGYRRSDIVGRNCRFLQGPMTDRTTVARIRENIIQGKESVELILNYREDGAPFWNLVYICPLADAKGRVRYFLGAQINVSETLGSHKDVLRVLHFGSSSSPTSTNASHAEDDTFGPARVDTYNSNRRPSTTGTICKEAKLRNKDLTRSKSSRRMTKSFFGFRKSPNPDEFSPTQSRSPPSRSADSAVAVGSSSTNSLHSPSSPQHPNLESSLNQHAFAKRLALPTQISAFRTAYSRFFVLRHSPAGSVPTKKSTSWSRGRLVIDFASPGALEALNLTLAADAILGKDVFTVLAEQASCISVTRGFKSSVRENVLREGRALTVDMVFSGLGSSSGRKNSIGGGEGKGGRLIGYWTPVKDGVGEVCWVVLVVSPGF